MDVREKEQRNAKYNEYVEQITPKNNLFAVCFKAFILGGSICLLGQIIVNIALNMGVDEEKAPVWCSLILVFIRCWAFILETSVITSKRYCTNRYLQRMKRGDRSITNDWNS